MNPRRRERLAHEIRTVVADLVAQKLKDPRIGFVTVTRAELTADLALVRVYVSVLGEQAQREASLEGLSRAAGFVRRELGRQLRLRQTPEVTFAYDRGIEAADRIARLIDASTGEVRGEATEGERAEDRDDDGGDAPA